MPTTTSWRQSDLLREAEERRLAPPRHTGAAHRLALELSRTLVRLGTTLQTSAGGACTAGHQS
jgi:hypothetical protein